MMNQKWITTWGTSQQLVEPGNLPPVDSLENKTLRQSIRISFGGQKLRIRFSNAYGNEPVMINSVHLAKTLDGSSIITSTDTGLLFNGQQGITIPAGEECYCDAVDFEVEQLCKLTISIWYKKISATVLTGHPGSRTTSYIKAGNCTGHKDLSESIETDHWYTISEIEILKDETFGNIVVLGDSITDGRGTTTNGNDRWTDILAERLQNSGRYNHIGVINRGLGGNKILSGGLGPTAMNRFDRDVLATEGVRWLIILEGVNDIGESSSNDIYDPLISAFREFITKAHKQNIRVYASPVLPIMGHDYGTQEHERLRQKINKWIRGCGEFDGVIDLDKAVSDPENPGKLLDLYDTGDNLHLSPAGYKCMGNTVDLELFDKK